MTNNVNTLTAEESARLEDSSAKAVSYIRLALADGPLI